MTQPRRTAVRRPRRGRVAVAVVVVLALVAGAIYWLTSDNSPLHHAGNDTTSGSYRDIGGGVSVLEGTPDTVHAAVDAKVNKPPFEQVQQLSPVVHVTPDGPQSKPVTLRFKLNRKIDDPRDVVIAVNETGKATDWQLVPATKVEGEYAYVTTTHLSWWDPLWRSFTDLVNATMAELKDQLNGLTGDAFAEAEKPKCDNEGDARSSGYSIKWSGAETLYYCLGLDNGKPVAHIVNKRRYPILVNHKGITVPQPKSRFGVDWLATQSFSDNRTVMLPFDQIQLNYDLAKGDSKSFDTEYNGFAEGLNQLEFGITTLINILTRFGAGAGTISNGAIKITQFDRVAETMSKALTIKDCAKALNTDKPNSGAILSGCFSPAAIADMFGWKGVLVALVMVVAPVVNFFRGQFETLGDLLQGKDQETVTVSYNPPAAPKVLFAGMWYVHGAQMVINKDGTGTYTWNAGPCTQSLNETRMCQGHASLAFKVEGGSSMTGTYSRVWYTNDSQPAPSDFSSGDDSRMAGKTFTIKGNDKHTLITGDGTGSRPGNPYLCDNYAEQHNDSEYQLCGA